MLGYNCAECDGIDLCLEGIRSGGQDYGSLRAHQDAAVLEIRHADNGLVDKVACMDIGEQEDVCVTDDLAAGSACLMARYRTECIRLPYAAPPWDRSQGPWKAGRQRCSP